MENSNNENPNQNTLSQSQAELAFHNTAFVGNTTTSFFEPIVTIESSNRVFTNRRRSRIPNLLPLSEFHHIPFLSRRVRRNVDRVRLEDYDSNEDEPQQESEYIDFRNYPLNIDWKDVEDEETIAYEILNEYGHFGLVLYTKLKEVHVTEVSRIGNFLMRVIEEYNERIYNGRGERSPVQDFIKLLPPLFKIQEILNKNLFTSKDVLPMKVILDIYENFYFNSDYPLYDKLIKQLIPTATLFYMTITDDDLKVLSLVLKAKFKKYIGKKLVYTTKEKYLLHYRKLKNDIQRLSEGNSIEKFLS